MELVTSYGVQMDKRINKSAEEMYHMYQRGSSLVEAKDI
jgi:hypothetical protein